jgi:RNA polymerase sigma-70 factor (ECF subfamily)
VVLEADQAAVEDVLRDLDPCERNVLRMHMVHQLSIDEIGRTYEVHRATAARWLTSIRDRLQDETRKLLRDRLGLADRELDSLFRVVESQLEFPTGSRDLAEEVAARATSARGA